MRKTEYNPYLLWNNDWQEIFSVSTWMTQIDPQVNHFDTITKLLVRFYGFKSLILCSIVAIVDGQGDSTKFAK